MVVFDVDRRPKAPNAKSPKCPIDISFRENLYEQDSLETRVMMDDTTRA
jgi:hypothetical protein